MTANQNALIGVFLTELSERFSNDGCNDYQLPNTPENRALAKAAFVYGVGENEPWEEIDTSGDTFYVPGGNNMLVDYLAHLLAQDIKANET